MKPQKPYQPPGEQWLRHVPLAPSDPLRGWLSNRGSLTARIRARCRRFEVRVLRQHLALPLEDERRVLSARAHSLALVREVLLVADGVPVVFAHSAILPRHVRGVWHLVTGLGARPLGSVLFADPAVSRGRLYFQSLRVPDERWQLAACAISGQAPACLWARRSVFLKQERPLLVTEVLLPNLLELTYDDPK
ncbi:MAG: chorismate lyase [Betaproteobacteria bacterium]|nr:chorismate lyase [Betaproteobacteria bacterium]